MGGILKMLFELFLIVMARLKYVQCALLIGTGGTQMCTWQDAEAIYFEQSNSTYVVMTVKNERKLQIIFSSPLVLYCIAIRPYLQSS